MPLAPKISLINVAKDASYITLQDTTGVYNATTNVGGYGSPNPSVPTRIGLVRRYWPSLIFDNNIASTTLSLQSALQITPAMLGGSGAFADGVQHFKYYSLEAVSGTFSIANKSALLSRISGSVNLNDIFTKTTYTGVEISGQVYDVDFTKPVTATTMYLTTVYQGDTGSYAIYKGIGSDIKVLVDAAANKVFAKRVLAMATDESDSNIKLSSRILMFIQAAQVDMNCKNYDKAHNLIVLVPNIHKTVACYI